MAATPARPEEEESGPSHVNRRDMLDTLLGGGSLVWAAGVAVPTGLYLWPARASGPGSEYVEAGKITDFPIGSSRMVQMRGKPIVVLRLGETDFRALSAICPHLGCVVVWNPTTKLIHCPCHAGFFGPDGSVTSGPTPRPLAAYRVVVVGEALRVYS